MYSLPNSVLLDHYTLLLRKILPTVLVTCRFQCSVGLTQHAIRKLENGVLYADYEILKVFRSSLQDSTTNILILICSILTLTLSCCDCSMSSSIFIALETFPFVVE